MLGARVESLKAEVVNLSKVKKELEQRYATATEQVRLLTEKDRAFKAKAGQLQAELAIELKRITDAETVTSISLLVWCRDLFRDFILSAHLQGGSEEAATIAQYDQNIKTVRRHLAEEVILW